MKKARDDDLVVVVLADDAIAAYATTTTIGGPTKPTFKEDYCVFSKEINENDDNNYCSNIIM